MIAPTPFINNICLAPGIEEHQREHAATCKPEYVALTTFGQETKIQLEFTTNLDAIRQKLGGYKTLLVP